MERSTLGNVGLTLLTIAALLGTAALVGARRQV